MKTHIKMIAAALLLAVPALAFAQTDPHHPTEDPTAAAPAEAQPTSPEPMQMMMQMMQNCMGMMQMMQGGMGQGMMQGGAKPMQGGMSDAMQAYMAAMLKMEAPMMQGIQASDPDVAFVKAMIPHHQSAIDMARAALQYGKDERVKTWADQIIAAQEKEITEMEAWLQENSK